jgi:hypothetical protein
MNTVHKMLITLLILSSCGKETVTSTTTGTNTATSTATQVPTTTSVPTVTTTSTPTTGVTSYPDADPVVSVTLPGTAYSKCGVLYKELNSDDVTFLASNSKEFVATHYTQSAKAFLYNIKFLPDFSRDAYDVCLDGYKKGSDLFVTAVTSSSATDNPSIVFKSYTARLCGYTAYQRSADGNTYLTLQVDQTNYRINTSTNYSSIPSIGSAQVTAANSVEVCYYSNKAPYNDFNNLHYKPYFDVVDGDFGAL